MDISSVYKALPTDLFMDILDRFKRQQASKKSCKVEYMTSELNHFECYRDVPWARFILTNDEADDVDEQEALDYLLNKRMNGVLRDTRYTFYPMDEVEYYDTDDEYSDYSYDLEFDLWEF
jgi:hypothetical protein